MALDVFMQGYSFVRRNFFFLEYGVSFTRFPVSLWTNWARTRGRPVVFWRSFDCPIVLTFLLPMLFVSVPIIFCILNQGMFFN